MYPRWKRQSRAFIDHQLARAERIPPLKCLFEMRSHLRVPEAKEATFVGDAHMQRQLLCTRQMRLFYPAYEMIRRATYRETLRQVGRETEIIAQTGMVARPELSVL